MRPVRLALLGLAAALPSPVAAQTGDCRDDNGQDRCTVQAQARQRAIYGIEPIEEMARGKAHVLRAFFVDGYGQDSGLITAVRAPGAEPRIEVSRRRPDGQGGVAQPPMAAPLALATWQRLVAEARYVERLFAAEPTGPNAWPNICLHAWMVTVEVADPDGKVRRRTQDSCDDGLAVPFAFELARSAVAEMPACGLIADSTTRNDVTRLAACAGFSGDRTAAAEAWNWLDASPLGGRTDPGKEQRLRYAFRQRTRLAWEGRPPVQTDVAAAQLWLEERVRRFWPAELIGEAAMRVRVKGRLALTDPDGAPSRPWPSATMVLTRSAGSDFAVESIEVTTAAK